jgi:alkaline phosphatase
MTRVALSKLNHSTKGYFLVVEHDLVARAAERNFTKLAVNEVNEVDEAIQSAVEYAGPDALVIVTNNYSLGAMGPLPTPAADNLAASPNTVNADGDVIKPQGVPMATPPQPSWLAGPGGPTITRAQAEWVQKHWESGWFSSAAPDLLEPDSAFVFQTQAWPTAEPAWLASRGEGASQLRGFLNNTDVFEIVNENF